MQRDKIRVLAVAPYEGMKTLMTTVANKRDTIELNVLIGDLNEGLELVKNVPRHNYDVILSRGGTAELLENSIDVPVIEINLSVYDILRAIRLAENHSGEFSIVGYPNITNDAYILRDLLQFDTSIITINDSNEALNTLEYLKNNGCQLVVCDMVTFTHAKQIGLNSILITSGVESIETAFNQIEKITNIYSYFEDKNQLLTKLILEQNLPVAIFDCDSKLYFSSKDDYNNDTIIKIFKKEVKNVLANGNVEVIKKNGSYLYSIAGKKVKFKNADYIFFYLNHKPLPLSNFNNGIKYLDKNYASLKFNESLFKKGTSNSYLNDLLQKYAIVNYPILIIGDEGTGKDSVAYYLYINSILKNNPLILIDCEAMSDKYWKYFIDKIDSPIYNDKCTFYFKNFHTLDKKNLENLIMSFNDMNIFKRNRIFFSMKSLGNFEMHSYLTNKINFLILKLPTLENNPNMISDLCSIFISELNVQFAKQIIGFEPNAITMLQNFNWQYNFNQFKRVLTTIFTLCDTTYISEILVENVLNDETFYTSNDTNNNTYKGKTLNEINKEIALDVLKEEDNNQSKTANRLGISRTTLWRLLKEY